MSQIRYEVDEVYGVTREVPINYVERDGIDSKLQSDLERGKHIVIYGSSKQGKTCLRKHCIEEKNQIVIQCSNNWDIKDIHESILKEAGYDVTLSEKETVSGTRKIRASVSSRILGTGGKVGGESADSEKREVTKKKLDLDPTDVNDIIRALDEIDLTKYIVLEDFHYLPEEAQKDFAVALKAFHEKSSLCFIVVGVWLEENRLIVHNGDLTGRVISVNADTWNHNQLRRVIEKGEDALNVSFDLSFTDELINNCFESVHMLQEACRNVCLESEISDTQEELSRIGKKTDAIEMIGSVVDDQSGRYRSFIRKFSDGFQKTELEMYKWLLYPVLTADTAELEDGLIYGDLREKIEAKHPRGEDLNPGNLTQSLKSTASLQVDQDIKPIILDYDHTDRRLSVVDRGFLIWMENQKEMELLRQAGLREKLQ